MYHFVYRTTNTINGKIYIGKHSTEDLDDGYIGSGKALLRAVNKYGKDAFTREIISYHPTSEDAFIAESELVTEEFVGRHNTYNMMTGGLGRGLGYSLPEESRVRISKKTSEHGLWIRKIIQCTESLIVLSR